MVIAGVFLVRIRSRIQPSWPPSGSFPLRTSSQMMFMVAGAPIGQNELIQPGRPYWHPPPQQELSHLTSHSHTIQWMSP